MDIHIERYTVAGKCTPCLSTLQRTVESNRNLHIIATVIMILVGGKMFSYVRCFLTQTRYQVSISEHSVANKNQGSVVTINKIKARQVAAMFVVLYKHCWLAEIFCRAVFAMLSSQEALMLS